MKGKKRFLRVSCIILSFLLTIGSLTFTNSYATRINENVEAPIELIKEVEKNQFLVDEEFTITYRLQPSAIPADSIIPDTYLKDKEIVLVIDSSGSMDWDINGKRTNSNKNKRITIAKNAAKHFVDKFKDADNVRIGLIDYDNKAHIEKVDGNELVNKRKFDNLKRRIDNNFPARGATNIGDGLRRAYWLLKNSTNDEAKKYIILMTDGEPTALSFDQIVIRHEKRTTRRGREHFVDIEYPIYKLDDGVVSNNKIWNYGDDDPYGYALEYAKTVASQKISSGDPTIDTFIIGFSNDVNKDKLQQIADSSDGFYKEAKTAEDINEVYEKLADQIQSDLPIHSINFQETFSDGLDILEVSEGLEINGQTVTGDIGSIKYKLNEDTDQFEADPLEFSIKLKGSDIGDYTLSVGDENNSSSIISYNDIDGSGKDKSFLPIDISIYKDILAPEVNIKVSDYSGEKDTYAVDSENEDIRVDKMLNPSITLRGDSFAQIDVKAKDVNFFKYQFINTSETPQNMPIDNWQSINLDEETINDDVVLEKRGYLNKRAYDVNHMPTLNNKEKWEKPEEVFKTPFEATTHMSAAYSSTPSQYGSLENYLLGDSTMGKRWSTNSIFMKNMDITWHDGDENSNYKEASKFWGYIKVPQDGSYKFGAYSDDGCRGYITVEGQTNAFVDMFKIQGSKFGTENKVFNLKADKYYPIYLEYFNWGGWAHYEITYSDNGSYPNKRIPAEWFYPSKNITPGEYATTIFTGSKGVKFPSESGDYYIAFRIGKDDNVTREGIYGSFTVDGNTSLNLSKTVDNENDIIQTYKIFTLEYRIEPQDIVPRSTFKDTNGNYKEKVYLSNVKIQDEYPENIEIREDVNNDGIVINGQKITANISDIEYSLIDNDGSKVYSAQPITLDVSLIAKEPGEYTLSESGKSVITFDDFNESKPQLEFDPIGIDMIDGIPIKDVDITGANNEDEVYIVEKGKLINKVSFTVGRDIDKLKIKLSSDDLNKYILNKVELKKDDVLYEGDWSVSDETDNKKIIEFPSNIQAGYYECILLMKIDDEGSNEKHIKIGSTEVKENYYEENETKTYDLDPKPSLKITIVPDPNIL